ncbi:NusG domain II-containing protein [Clostridium ganghwense]|uniref:NusG domain II-containing protein n=1 Tax=Clostridium ganghwense TaxID=312089 RepID=A0ABT4CPK3_9CLOT|nr:NusG domain II-containing protein [Clostridium ganghwense]MCY6370166.1 NusG domain II-containing protein [Clostridium ganghwense]
MKKFDKIIIVFCVCIAVGLGIFFKVRKKADYAQKYAEIYVKGNLYKKVILTKEMKKDRIDIKTELGENIIEIENGGVRIIDSDCPDQICVKDGFKDEPGDILVCLPHKVVVEIKGEKKSDIDEVSF